MPGPVVNEWPALLEGVTAQMSFDADEAFPEPEITTWGNTVTVQLYVSGGNIHLPDGEQTLRLNLVPNGETPSILSMMLNTDGQQWPWRGMPEAPTIEDKLFDLTARMVGWARLPIERTIIFIQVFEGEIVVSEDEMIASAEKYLGIESFSPSYWHWDGTAPEGERSHFVRLNDDGKYEILGMGFHPPAFSTAILDAPSQGDLTVRVFIYANYFRFEVASITDFNFLVLYNDDGTPYARLLSEQAVDLGGA